MNPLTAQGRADRWAEHNRARIRAERRVAIRRYRYWNLPQEVCRLVTTRAVGTVAGRLGLDAGRPGSTARPRRAAVRPGRLVITVAALLVLGALVRLGGALFGSNLTDAACWGGFLLLAVMNFAALDLARMDEIKRRRPGWSAPPPAAPPALVADETANVEAGRAAPEAPEVEPAEAAPDLRARFEAKIDRDPEHGGCWRWTGAHDSSGHGSFRLGGRPVGAHRAAYQFEYGEIPDGAVIDHVKARGCRFRDCVRPSHLEAVTVAENTRRGRAGGPNGTYAQKLRRERAAS